MATPNADFAFMVEQAIKAPSGHNTQPWLFALRENSISIYPDRTKALPVVDPNNRELFVSLGCATENLCISATHKCYDPIVQIDPANSEIRVTLARKEHCIATPLFSQIASRQTNRSVYNAKLISEDKIESLRSLPRDPNVAIRFFARGSSEFNKIATLIYEGNRIQMENSAFRAELKQWMRYNKHHQDATHDGLSYAVFGAPNLPKWLVRPIMSHMLNARTQNQSDKKKIESSSHFVLFTTKHDDIYDWVNLGRTLERFQLRTTEMGLAHAYMNQPNEIPELEELLTNELRLDDEYPTILLRIGYAPRMPYSLRRAPRFVSRTTAFDCGDEAVYRKQAP